MQKVAIDALQPGMILAKTIYNEHGSMLLTRGALLTEHYIQALKTHGYYSAFICDGIGDDVEPVDIITPQVRSATYRHLKELFNAASIVGRSFVDSGDTSDIWAGPMIAQLYRDVERIIDSAISAQVLSGTSLLKAHDSYTFDHSIETTVVAVILGLRLSLPFSELQQLAMGCLLHDIGKADIPQEILNKPGVLSQSELDVVQQHPRTGYNLVNKLLGSNDILARNVVLQHHERQDGTGYPQGLVGNNHFGEPPKNRFGKRLILPVAEIASVADAYSVLGSDRPYRKALCSSEILTAMQQVAGTHLNREIVMRFFTILPAFPVGTEVMIIRGRYRDFRGVVTDVSPNNVKKITVRLLFGPKGRKVHPVEVCTLDETDMQLALPSYGRIAKDEFAQAV